MAYLRIVSRYTFYAKIGIPSCNSWLKSILRFFPEICRRVCEMLDARRWALLALALCCVEAAKHNAQIIKKPTAWISEGFHPHRVDGRPIEFHDANRVTMQRVVLGATTRDSGAKRFDVPELGQYMVRVASPVRKNLASDLRALAVGPVR